MLNSGGFCGLNKHYKKQISTMVQWQVYYDGE